MQVGDDITLVPDDPSMVVQSIHFLAPRMEYGAEGVSSLSQI
jgi:hypothetical protein